jgi:hypothetical protein
MRQRMVETAGAAWNIVWGPLSVADVDAVLRDERSRGEARRA